MLEISGKYCKDVKIFTDNIEESALRLIYDIADERAFEGGKIRIMPDVHAGIGIVIGFSSPIDVEKGAVNPAHVGCDVGCTVSSHFYDVRMPSERIAEFEHKIRKEVPFGFELNTHSKIDVKTILKAFDGVLNRVCSMYPPLAEYRVRMKTEKDLEDWCKRLGMDFGVFLKSIGTVGGGNHFCEYDVNDEKGLQCVTVHCGSRNLGIKVFNYWSRIAKTKAATKKALKAITEKVKAEVKDKTILQEKITEAHEAYKKVLLPNYLQGAELYGYLIDMVLAQEYAALNHKVIHDAVDKIYAKMCGGKVIDTVTTTHNYIDFDFKALSGKPNMMIRKGAIRAYEGERCIIPFNMRDGLAICVGKSNDDWNCTAPHGCGRALSRTKAHQQLNVEDFKATMEAAGVYTTTADASTLDESPAAYKPCEEIIKLIEPTVSVLYMMKPRMNIKALE